MLWNNSILSHLRAEYGFPSCRSVEFSYLEQYAVEILQLLFTTGMVYQASNTEEGKWTHVLFALFHWICFVCQ